MTGKEAPADLLVVHLTDLHIKNAGDDSLKRIRQMAPVIGARIDSPTVVVIAITGDIAFSGKAEQYALAIEALKVLERELKAWNVVDVVFAVSPGNHDCDFSAMKPALRKALLEGVGSASEDVGALLEMLAPTQAQFSDFASAICGSRLTTENSLVSTVKVESALGRVVFASLNTAITSSLEERPGVLCVPATELRRVASEADYCVVLAHHPLNWMAPSCAVSTSEWLDENADLVLLGHEHRLDLLRQARVQLGAVVDYQVGLPLSDAHSAKNGFRILKFGSGTNSLDVLDVEWNGAKFLVRSSEQISVSKNAARARGTVRFSDSHKRFLLDPGAAFSHPRINRDVALGDIFVAPEFREFRAERAELERTDGAVLQEDLCKKILEDDSRSVVFGIEQSGKTTFAKYLVGWLRQKSVVPVYVDAGLLKSTNKGEIRGWYKSAIESQFSADAVEKVLESPPKEIVVILDNAQTVRGGDEGVREVLNFVSSKSSRVLILTADNPALSVLSVGTGDDPYWKGADVYELLPLGHRRRGELIRRWVSLGRNQIDDALQIEAEVRQVKDLLDKVLGRDSLPKFPLFILILLQQLEGVTSSRTLVSNGSHGYLFEALITQAIDRDVRSHEINTVVDFLASFAREVWARQVSGLSELMLERLAEDFLRKKLVRIDKARLLEELVRARLLVRSGSLLCFRYNYVYYYYLAKWIVSRVGDGESESLLDELVPLVHTELSSNVLMFVSHLGHESRVVGRLLPFLKGLFASEEDAIPSLEAYSPLCMRFRTAAQRTFLLEGPAPEVSDKVHADQDRSASGRTAEQSTGELEGALRLNSTLKSIQTLGQVLKGRAASLPPDAKLEIAGEIISASRRLMAFFFGFTEVHAEEIVRAASDAFEKSFRLDRAKAVEVANGMIGALVVGFARLCVTRAADAIGSSELSPLLDEICEKRPDDDAKLVVAVARVVGEKVYPKELVEEFIRSIKESNVLPRAVLSHAVARRFYLDPPDRGIRDSACSLLGIDVRRLPPSSGGSRPKR